jgi:tetratricopeptide (TPR) repeat protein
MTHRTALVLVLALAVSGGWPHAIRNRGNLRVLSAVRGSGEVIPPAPDLARVVLRQASSARNLAGVMLAARQPVPADSAARVALASTPRDFFAQYWHGLALWETGRKEEARRVWRECGVMGPKIDALLRRFWTEASRGNRAAAERLALEAVDLDPRSGPVYSTVATLWWGRDWARVIDALQSAVRFTKPGTAEYYWDLGRLRLIQGDWNGAAEALGRSTALNPAEWTQRYLAEALRHAGRMAEADAVERHVREHYGR